MTRVFRICLALLFIVWSGISAAQQPDGDENPLYPFWDEFAARAEERVTAAQDSNEEFEELRARIVEFRSEFATRQSANAERIQTLQAQIEALGPVPESGEEPEDIAARRAELNAQLETLLAPVRAMGALQDLCCRFYAVEHPFASETISAAPSLKIGRAHV